jgi:hypothetical protein
MTEFDSGARRFERNPLKHNGYRRVDRMVRDLIYGKTKKSAGMGVPA